MPVLYLLPNVVIFKHPSIMAEQLSIPVEVMTILSEYPEYLKMKVEHTNVPVQILTNLKILGLLVSIVTARYL